MIITAYNPLGVIRDEYLSPYNGDSTFCLKVIKKTIWDRPIKNKFGIELPLNKYNCKIDLLEWLINSSWTFFLIKLHEEIKGLLGPYSGFSDVFEKKDNDYLILIDLGSLPKDKYEMYIKTIEEMIQTLDNTLKYVRIKTFSEARTPVTNASFDFSTFASADVGV